MKKTKTSLFHSGLALLLCISMLIGSTFAWFSDSISSGKNIITAGNLDLEMYWTDDLDSGEWHNVEENGHNTIFNYDNWEPGYTDVKYIKLVNAGDLALNYKLSLTPQNGVGKLAEVINVYFAEGGVAVEQRSDLQSLRAIGLLDNVLNGGATADGTLLSADQYSPLHPSGEVVMTVAMNMLTTAGNDYMNEDAGKFTITALATQAPFEMDSFGSDYDSNAEYPTVLTPDSVSSSVTPDNGKVPAGGVALNGNKVSAFVPEGVLLENGTTELTLTVTPLKNTSSDITVVNGEILIPVDVHIDGVAEGNTVPIIIELGEVLPKYLNMGNYHLYHVENGANSVMTLVAEKAALSAHNQFTYDPLTGAVCVAMKSFSEVTMLADTAAKWEGGENYDWYDASKTELQIANADQLYAFAKIVGNMANDSDREIGRDSFSGKTIKLLSDINLNHGTVLVDANGESLDGTTKKIFYPVGYYNSEGADHYDDKTSNAITSGFKTFEGTFDGAGHTISNVYQNTWDMKGDHDWYDAKDQHYRDGMGIFGRVYGGTIKNLTVDNFESDGEITTTGVIASYADFGATFENIAITNCNPRVYNIGNGGIVGCVGWYTKGVTDKKVTFKNITVDNSNKISALWGSYDVPCGGIVGQYYPTSGQTSAGTPKNAGIHFENCHVSAVMDVYNDVCANYQYYAYRYAGMLIGSVRENETIDGHVYPKMDGITAEDCTVHYDTWNDYYYCELVANSLASYTHDHQFSRLEQVSNVDGTTITPLEGNAFTVPTSGRYNYVVVNGEFTTENATCYHFVDGEVWNHADAGKETVNGVEVLKEDKQHIYLPFAQLFTGYGWGVTSKGIEDFAGIDTMDITQSQQKESVEKFASKADIDLSSIKDGNSVSIADLFVAIKNAGVEIKDETVMVAVTDLTKTGITADFTRGASWDQGTLKFNGTNGYVKITIQDYYFCKPTSVIVKVGEFTTTDRFGVVFPNTDKYLYRVGNQNNISISSLFKAIADKGIGNVSVDVETIKGNVAVTNTPNSTWTNGTLKFSGTGVVNITVSDDNFSTPVTLPVEVVDATNLISATGTTTGGNFVLLCDVNTSTYVNYWNCTLYGNGFTYSLKGAPTAYNSKQGKGILITKNAVLDNLVIVGDVYNGYGAYTENDYYNTAIDVTGDTVIQNCYVSGCSAPIRARNNVTINNSTLYGGAVANLIIESGTVTLEGVTTANYDDGRAVVGLGIVVHSDATEAAKLVLNGTLTQYNFISENKVPTDTNAKSLYNAMFGSSCSKYHFGTSPNRYLNTGIVSLTEVFNGEDITDNAKTGYSGTSVALSIYKGYVYTQPNTSGSVNNNFSEYKPTTQGAVPPSYSFDYTNKNYIAKTDGSNDYCYEENGKVNISMDEGDTFNWDTSILTIGKGITNYTVSMNGTDYTGKSIAFNTAGDYTVTYTYTDDNNYKLDENGNITTYSATYTKTVNITVAVVKATTKHAEFTFGSSNTASTTVTVGNNTYVMPNVSGTSNVIGSTTVNGQTIYYPIVEIIMSDGKTSHTSGWYAYFPVFSGAVTITDYANNGTGDKMTPYNGSTTTMPSGLSVVGDAKTLFKYQSGSNAGETPVVKNNKLVYSSAKIEAKRSEYSTVIQYSYTDNAGATYYYYIGYHAPAQSYSSCVTSDTLVTLADGTQKRIDQVGYDDVLLAWNMFTGEYVAVPASYIVYHGDDNYTVVNLEFSDGTTVKVIGEHGFYDCGLNRYVFISEENVASFVGHYFAQQSGNGFGNVTLVGYTVTKEYTGSYSMASVACNNVFANGMLSLTPVEGIDSDAFFNFLEMGDNMQYDQDKLQKEIETYGVFTYEELSAYMTREEFDAFVASNGHYLKIAIAKGCITIEEMFAMLSPKDAIK